MLLSCWERSIFSILISIETGNIIISALHTLWISVCEETFIMSSILFIQSPVHQSLCEQGRHLTWLFTWLCYCLALTPHFGRSGPFSLCNKLCATNVQQFTDSSCFDVFCSAAKNWIKKKKFRWIIDNFISLCIYFWLVIFL